MKLAFLFNISIPVLKRTNNLISDELYPGQILKVSLPATAEILQNPNVIFAEDEDMFRNKMPLAAKQSFGSLYSAEASTRDSFLKKKAVNNKSNPGKPKVMDEVSEEDNQRVSTDIGKPTSGEDPDGILNKLLMIDNHKFKESSKSLY
jgi:hypothetical protein